LSHEHYGHPQYCFQTATSIGRCWCCTSTNHSNSLY
jgi:hypothetical protein